MTDRERILTYLVRKLATGQIHASLGAQVQPCRESHQLTEGQIVVCVTSLEQHPYTVAEVVTPSPERFGPITVRDLVTGEHCIISNEVFDVITGLDRSDPVFLVGAERAFHEKLIKAFYLGWKQSVAARRYRLGDVTFQMEKRRRIACINVRHEFGGPNGRTAIPFQVFISFYSRTSVKDILAGLKDGGFGSREFELLPEESR